MKPMALAIVTTTWILAWASLVVAADPTSSPHPRFDLSKLRKFYEAKDWNPDTAVKELIGYLRGELEHPTEPAMGLGGGPIDTVYVQSVIIAVMGQRMPKQALLSALSQENDDRIKDRIICALVTAGDATFVNHVRSLLQTSKDNLIRLAATCALENAPREAIESVLPAMREDTYSRIVWRCEGQCVKVYPIRQAAYTALIRARVAVKDWKVEMPRNVESEADAVAAILEDENVDQSIAALQMLKRFFPAEAKRLAKAFVEAKAAKPHLMRAVGEAEKILRTPDEQVTR